MGKLSSSLWLILLVFSQNVLANSQYNMRKGVTDISNKTLLNTCWYLVLGHPVTVGQIFIFDVTFK